MKKLILYTALFVFSFNTCFSQTANIVIYTNDKDAFTVIMNDSALNDEPTSNIKLINVSRGLLKIVLKFENNKYNEIETNFYARPDTETVYIIKNNRKTEKIIRMYDKQPIKYNKKGFQINSVKYGNAEQVIVYVNKLHNVKENKVIENVNLNYQPKNHLPCNSAMMPQDFTNIIDSLKNIDFESEKLEIAKHIILTNCLSASQIRILAGTLDFEKNKLDLVKTAYKYTVDKNNYYIVNDVFEFASSISELTKYIKKFKN